MQTIWTTSAFDVKIMSFLDIGNTMLGWAAMRCENPFVTAINANESLVRSTGERRIHLIFKAFFKINLQIASISVSSWEVFGSPEWIPTLKCNEKMWLAKYLECQKCRGKCSENPKMSKWTFLHGSKTLGSVAVCKINSICKCGPYYTVFK